MTEKLPTGRYGHHIQTLLTISDIILVNLLLIAIIYLCHSTEVCTKMAKLIIVSNVAYIPVIIWQTRLRYNRRAIVMEHIAVNAFEAVGMHALFFLSILQILSCHMPFDFYLEFYGTLIVMLPLWWLINRLIIKRMRRGGRNFVRVVIVGTNRTARRLAKELTSDTGYGYKIYGHFDDECKNGFDGTYLGKIEALDSYIKEHCIDEVFFTLSGEAAESLTHVAKIADDNICSFYYVPQISKYVNAGYELHNLGAMPVLTLRHNPLNAPLNRFAKRTFDIIFSSLFLIISPIIFIPVAIAIKISSPGPVFFKQQRTGYRGKSFNCLKFRTMKVNAAADKAQATKDDPRKTRVGEFLRHTSIDELPQFINVFLGDMSVVGPRPHMLKHTEDYTRLIDQYMVRHVVKPGITGWAQVNGYRGLTDEVWKMERRVEYDVWYIEHWHFFLDLKIIVRTIINAIHGESNAF